MRKIKTIKTKWVLVLSAMLSRSILLSSCSSVITNDNSNIGKPVPSLELKILNNNVDVYENELIENNFDLFLKNLGFGIEKTTITQNWYNNYEILNKYVIY